MNGLFAIRPLDRRLHEIHHHVPSHLLLNLGGGTKRSTSMCQGCVGRKQFSPLKHKESFNAELIKTTLLCIMPRNSRHHPGHGQRCSETVLEQVRFLPSSFKY